MFQSHELWNNPTLSRRDFLQLSKNFLAAAAFPGHTVDAQSEALWDFRLEQYTGILKASRKIENLFGSPPDFFPTLIPTLLDVADGKIPDPMDGRVVRVRDGWGEQRKWLEADAQAHLNELNIDISPVTDGNTKVEYVQDFLRDNARLFPAFTLAMPLQVKVGSEGLGYAAEDWIQIQTPVDVMNAPFLYLHETTHEIDIYPYITKPYILESDYIHYVEEYLNQTHDFIIYQWLQRHQPQILAYLFGTPIIGEWIPVNNSTVVDQDSVRYQMRRMEEELGLSVLQPMSRLIEVSLPAGGGDHSLLAMYDWNILIHTVGNKLLDMLPEERQAYIAQHTGIIRSLFFDGIFSLAPEGAGTGHGFHLEGLVPEVMHNFVNPVVSDWQLRHWNNPLIQAMRAIQTARMNAYSLLPRRSGVYNVRDAFGMPRVAPGDLPAFTTAGP